MCLSAPHDKEHELRVVVFADASRTESYGQVGVIAGLLVDELQDGAIFHATSWLSHKAKRPVKSVPSAEILAAAEGIDEGKTVAATYSELLGMAVKLQVCVDSKDLYSTLSTQRNSVDRSIRGDVGAVRFDFMTGLVDKITWIPGKANLADVLSQLAR